MQVTTDNGSGITRHSVQVWRDNRQLFGTFVEANVYHGANGAVIDGRLFRSKEVPHALAPTMVLIDERGNELWLSGTPCGYVGEGPGGAESILREEGFGEPAAAVCDERFVKVVLRKNEHGAVTSQLTEQGATTWDGTGRILRWLWRQGRVTSGTDRTAEATRLTWDDPLHGHPPEGG